MAWLRRPRAPVVGVMIKTRRCDIRSPRLLEVGYRIWGVDELAAPVAPRVARER